ncbi:hypothetical protein OGAPHI_005610 [Ogataea philodendri]|uniref:Actin-like protein ARP6 n=1 Tax=Ogataea philodendri TaxID=1378263 RepID=A0A9P8T134_9ASCO|nr:uncharacterized protein OGAPHI_005610 [Ogataea philodendri]KAH3662358.1 hypothetical protein OGAPHI_005610 [Ogataea philodendri]
MNFIIDNGSYDIKLGRTTDDSPVHVPNCLVRSNDKGLYLGDILNSVGSIELSGLQFKRPIEHGQLYQWTIERQIWDSAFVKHYKDEDLLNGANVVYCETPVTYSKFQNNTDQVLFEEYGVGALYRGSVATVAPWITKPEGYNDFQLVIDSGYDATYVVPMINGLPYWKAVKKMSIAGRFINGYLREVISFRHYNVTDEPILVNNIKESACYVTNDYYAALAKVERLKKLKPKQLLSDPGNISTNYVLPDFKTTMTGYAISDQDLSSSVRENQQVLKLFDERFAVPEVLFQPEISGVHKAGLVKTIQESLQSVPELLRPLLCANVVLAGGTCNLPGLKERLISELNKEIPVDDEVKVFEWDGNYADFGWHAAKQFFAKGGFESVAVSKQEYHDFGPEYTQEKFGHKLMR